MTREMALPQSRVMHLCLLLFSMFAGRGQAQYNLSNYCSSCITLDAALLYYDNRPISCLGGLVFDDFEKCVCSQCEPEEVPAANDFLSSSCGEASTYVSCAPGSGPTPTFSYSDTYNPAFPTGTDSDSDSGSVDTGGSSSSGSSRRGGSRAGIKAGISIGVIAGVLIILGLFYFIIGRRKLNKMQKEKLAQNATTETPSGFEHNPPSNPNQQPGFTEKPSPVSNYTAVSTGGQNATYYSPPAQPPPPTQPEFISQPQPQTQPQPQAPPQEGLGPRWGEAPPTETGGPMPGRLKTQST